MPTGYRFAPRFRLVPENGIESEIDLSTAFLDAAGATRTFLTGARVEYPEDKSSSLDVNRELQLIAFGFRPEATLTFMLTNLQGYRVIAEIVNRLMDPTWRVYLSMSGGSNYREVHLVRRTGPVPIRDKTLAGARFDLVVQTVGLIDQLYPIEQGGWW